MQAAVFQRTARIGVYRAFIFGAVLLTGLTAIAAPITSAQNPGLCLDVAGGDSASGTKVQLAHCYGNQAQDWTWVDNTLQVFGKCLDVASGNTTPGTFMQIWDCNGSPAQTFGVSGTSLVWTGGNLCIDVPNGNAVDGQALRTWSCNQAAAQSFNGLSTSESSSGSSFTQALHPTSNTALCLDVAGGNTANGTKVQLANCYGANDLAQIWNYTDNSLRIFGNKCLDVNAGDTTPGVSLQIWDCNGSAAQSWTQDGSSFVWTGGNLCLDIPNNNAVDGQHVQTWSCNQSAAQSFQTAANISASTPAAAGSASADAPSADASSADTTGADWNLVWSDEFDGTTLDRSKWNVEVNCDGGGNNEWQCYVDDPANISVQNGVLSLNVIKQNYNGKPYTSGRINSSGKAHWTYGRFEARIKTPCGQGFWPAFWMIPEANDYGTWPTSGELDIMEVLGGSANMLYGTAHFGPPWPNQKQMGGHASPADGGNFCGSWHVYALEWSATQASWSVDGSTYYTLKNSDGDWRPLAHWPFDQKFYFILNNAMGGDWPGTPDSSIQSGSLQVDYVRAYSR